MKTQRILFYALMIVLLPALTWAHGNEHSFSDAVANYAAIGKALSQDSVEGVQDHATEILEFMDEHEAMMKNMSKEDMEAMHAKMMGMHGDMKDSDQMKGMHGGMKDSDQMMGMHGDMKGGDQMMGMHKGASGEKCCGNMHTEIQASLKVLSQDDLTIEQARKAYQDLSDRFVPMAQMMYEKSAQDPDWAVMTCPMVKAEWIQKDGKATNPYYGSKMLHCGKKVAALAGTESVK